MFQHGVYVSVFFTIIRGSFNWGQVKERSSNETFLVYTGDPYRAEVILDVTVCRLIITAHRAYAPATFYAGSIGAKIN